MAGSAVAEAMNPPKQISGTRAERRRALFRLYAENLKLFFSNNPELHGRAVCPICGMDFAASAVEADTLEMDLAHVYPESCGGRLETLACTACNSRMGTKYESHLARDQHIRNAVSGVKGKAINGRLNFNGIENLGVELAGNGDGKGFHIKIIKPTTDPKKVTELVDHVRTLPKHLKFSFRFTGPEPERQNIAMLGCAYLALYREFGLEYILLCHTKWIRSILLGETPFDTGSYRSIGVSAGAAQMFPGDLAHTIGVVNFRSGLAAWATVFPTLDPEQPFVIILLPGPGDKAWQDYQAIRDLPEDNIQGFAYEMRMSWPEYRLGNPYDKGYARAIWNEVAAASS